MQINKEICDICGTCSSVCPQSAITVKEFEVLLDNEKCIKCNICTKVCPAQAISSGNDTASIKVYQHENESIVNSYDVVVIGAGPAGSVTARFIAEKGFSVLVLERDREPGIPVRCAEGVSHNGLIPYIDLDKKWICTTIEGARLHSPNGDSVDMYNNGIGYVLDRRVFDRALADLAVSKGARLLTKADAIGLLKEDNKITGVQYRHENKIYNVNCKIVIGADGVESQVGRWAGFDTCLNPNDLETCCQYTVNNINIETQLCQFYFGREIAPGGYLWIFPKSETQANIGIGIAASSAEIGKGPKYYLDKFMEKNYPNASVNYIVYGGVPTRAGNDFVKDNIMLVGDAAHQVNPITGGGLAQALIAGKYCGDTAAKALQENNFKSRRLKEYHDKWESHLGKNQRFLYDLKFKFFGFEDSKFNNIVKICKKIPREDMNLQRLFTETLREDPMMLAQLATSFLVSRISK